VLEELEKQLSSTQTAKGVYWYQGDNFWTIRPEKGQLLAKKKISKWNQPNPLREDRQLEEEQQKSTNHTYAIDNMSKKLGRSLFGGG
jgi:hypothetical protein